MGIDVTGVVMSLLNALIFGSALSLMAIGLSITYSVSRIANFAHGDLAVTGILAYLLVTKAMFGSVGSVQLTAHIFGFDGLATLARILAAFAMGALVAVAMLWLVFRPLRSRGATPLQLMVASIGVELLLRNIYYVVYMLSFGAIILQAGKGEVVGIIGGVKVRENDVISWMVAAAVYVILFIFLTRTMLGVMLRATADNIDLAEATGVDTALVETVAWIIGGGLAAVGGVLWYVWQPPATHPMESGWLLLAFVFAAVTLGGLGSIAGAVVASFIITLAYYPITDILIPFLQSMGLPVSTGIGYAVPLAVVIISLLIMPEGLAPHLRRLWFRFEEWRLVRMRERLALRG